MSPLKELVGYSDSDYNEDSYTAKKAKGPRPHCSFPLRKSSNESMRNHETESRSGMDEPESQAGMDTPPIIAENEEGLPGIMSDLSLDSDSPQPSQGLGSNNLLPQQWVSLPRLIILHMDSSFVNLSDPTDLETTEQSLTPQSLQKLEAPQLVAPTTNISPDHQHHQSNQVQPALPVPPVKSLAEEADSIRQTPEGVSSSINPSRKRNAEGSLTSPEPQDPGSPPAQSAPTYIKQPKSRDISHEQLANEVRLMYLTLVTLESRCIEANRTQMNAFKAGQPCELTSYNWRTLIAVHRRLLHEIHDFFLASLHPSASPAIKRLAAKHSIPARLWRHAIFEFLEVLRCRLPESREYLLTFIYSAYQMLALLLETVPAFESVWIEALGDAARYRMSIEESDRRDRATWARTACQWYNKAADMNPQVGRVYHHIAVLNRPLAIKQMYYHCKALMSIQPFQYARESIKSILDPIMSDSPSGYSLVPDVELAYARAISVIFNRGSSNQFYQFMNSFLQGLDEHYLGLESHGRVQGVYVAVINISCLLDFGSPVSPLVWAFQGFPGAILTPDVSDQQGHSSVPGRSQAVNPRKNWSEDVPMLDVSVQDDPSNLFMTSLFDAAWHLTFQTFYFILDRFGDPDVLPHVHVMLVFLFNLTRNVHTRSLAQHVDWGAITGLLNSLSRMERPGSHFERPEFPSQENDGRPLPEDYMIREQVWSTGYYPTEWFSRVHLDEEERKLELASTETARVERILWLGLQIALFRQWIEYSYVSQLWSTVSAYVHE